jgi:hypothetical protein
MLISTAILQPIFSIGLERYMSTHRHPTAIHLVGSVPLADSEAVFRAVSSSIGAQVRRMPDGETGIRTNWLSWQIKFLSEHPDLEVVPPDPASQRPMPQVKLRGSAAASEITFKTLGYADVAKASYAVFARLKQSGVVPAHARFQVSLPTPIATVTAFVVPEDQAALEPAYERGLLAEVDQIAAAIPHSDLAIQWDVAVEFAILENFNLFRTSLHQSKDPQQEILDRLIRIGKRVPADVELGYHLCYGDAGHQHFKQPEDTSKLVAVANGVSAGLTRPINWIHLPVPRDRMDDAYFAPLRGLKLHPETELYLGLVHLTDGVEGTRKRMHAAQQAVATFGIATECGMGRRPPETIAALLQVHFEVAAK